MGDWAEDYLDSVHPGWLEAQGQDRRTREQALATRIRELEAERESWRRKCAKLDGEVIDQRRRAEKAEAENARLREAGWAAVNQTEELCGPPPSSSAPIRDVVWRFAEAMEQTLRRHDHKGGWERCDIAWLISRLREEVDEVERELEHPGITPSSVSEEAVDVANFAMMIWDIARLHEAKRGTP